MDRSSISSAALAGTLTVATAQTFARSMPPPTSSPVVTRVEIHLDQEHNVERAARPIEWILAEQVFRTLRLDALIEPAESS